MKSQTVAPVKRRGNRDTWTRRVSTDAKNILNLSLFVGVVCVCDGACVHVFVCLRLCFAVSAPSSVSRRTSIKKDGALLHCIDETDTMVGRV